MAARKAVVSRRSVLVELPEDVMVVLVRRAADEQLTVHEVVEQVLTNWLQT